MDPSLTSAEKEAAIDAANKKYSDHDNQFKVAEETHHIYTQLNRFFKEFITENQIASINQITPLQRQEFHDRLAQQAQIIFTKMQRQQKYLPDISLPDIHELEQFLQNNPAMLTSKLMRGEQLKLDDEDFAHRMEIYDQLSELRERETAQVLANINASQSFDEAVFQRLKCLGFLMGGLFLKRENAHVGFCDEHARLATYLITDEFLIDHYEITIEVIYVEYFDENRKSNDGHVFLAINRDPNSQLNDISSWGADAILFDAWNKLVCYASEYHKLPTHYLSFPSDTNSSWNIKHTFNLTNRFDTKAITQLDRNYFMTGNSQTEKRIPLIMDEYKLIPLNQPDNARTSEFLYQLSRDMRPPNFNFVPELFLTTDGDEFVQVIPGFTEPKIAIHKDFVLCNQEEMQFAMARALVTTQHHWAGMTAKLSIDQQFQVNSRAVEISQNGTAAISFLRKSSKFKEAQSDDERYQKLTTLLYPESRITPSSPTDQIKTLMTLFALDEYHYLNTAEKEKKQTPISDTIIREMSGVRPIVFFEEGFNACGDNHLAKIKYLISCLPELKKELMPYELKNSNARITEFSRLLLTMNINLRDNQQRLIVDELLNAAFNMRVPGFEVIYFAVHGEVYQSTYGSGIFKALGPFFQLQIEINKFVNANSFDDAKNAASSIKQMRINFKNHFVAPVFGTRAGIEYTDKYEKDHEGQLPTGNDRFFGSSLGHLIKWQGFVVDSTNDLPWKRHIEYAKTNLEIAETLWNFGIRKYIPLWDVLPPRDLLRLNDTDNKPLLNIRGRLGVKFGYNSEWIGDTFESLTKILTYLSQQHPLRTDMFAMESDFREAFNQFYDCNWQKLAYPQAEHSPNFDNEAVRYLLDKFGEVALRGTESDKQVIKDFFTAQISHRGFRQLQLFVYDSYGSPLRNNSPYIIFLINSAHQGSKFTLFTRQEIIELLLSRQNGKPYTDPNLPLSSLLKIYDLPFGAVTIECLETLFPLMVSKEVPEDFKSTFLEDFFQINSPPALSTVMMRLIPFLNIVSFDFSIMRLDWQLPNTDDQVNSISLKDIIYLYRYYDNRFTFPNVKTKQEIGQYIIKQISLLKDSKQKIDLLESLLLQDVFILPLSDMQLRIQAIDLWVSSMATFYGKDTGLVNYQEAIIPIITHLIHNAAKRDVIIMLDKLANAIESQWIISEFLGEQLEAEKFLKTNNKKDLNGVAQLSIASKYLSDSVADQHQFLDFISAPLTNKSLTTLAHYIESHNRLYDFLNRVNPTLEMPRNSQGLRTALHSLYFVFWDRTIEQRAVIIDEVIIPASKVNTDETIKQAYQQGFDYIAKKLFPRAVDPNSDDHFAYALIKAYLDTADKYIRSILLAGMLVASNEASQSEKPLSAGKKIAKLCEHMGPAYINLAQAIHSHPSTPDHIRSDLDHVKGNAHPPYRWQLWRLAQQFLSKSEFDNIKRIGKLLGSASYNLALEVEFKNNLSSLSTTLFGSYKSNHVVLLLLRENAKRDADKGFKHLRATILACDHSRMTANREAVLSIIHEAEHLSTVEMDKNKSEQQYRIAADVYKNIKINVGEFVVNMSPVKLLRNGQGYRFIERVYGEEFNNLPSTDEEEKQIRQAITTEVI